MHLPCQLNFVIDAPRAQLDAVVDGLEARGLYVSREAAEEAFQVRGQFNAIDPERGWKVDLIFRKHRPFSEAEFARRRPASLLGVAISLTSPEDLIVAKLEWGRLSESELQQRDVVELVEKRWQSLDLPYIERWVGELGLGPAWAAVLERASVSKDQT